MTTLDLPPIRTIGDEQRRAAEMGCAPESEDYTDAPAPRRGRPIAIILAGLILAGLAGVAVASRNMPSIEGFPVASSQPALQAAVDDLTLPEVTPIAYRDLSAVAAEAWNAAFPVDPRPSPAAAPFRIPAEATVEYARAVDCLTAAIHYEAATETADGMRAVAQVVLNRVRHPAFPHTVCGVVFQGANLPTGCQFTFSCDGALDRGPAPAAWARARQTAISALAGYVYAPVGTATHYHTKQVVPTWAPNLSKIGNVGAHVFYTWKGPWGLPSAFRSPYSAAEVDVATLYGVGKAPFQDEAKILALTTPSTPSPDTGSTELALATIPEPEAPVVLALNAPAPPSPAAHQALKVTPTQTQTPAPQTPKPAANPLTAQGPKPAPRIAMAAGF